MILSNNKFNLSYWLNLSCNFQLFLKLKEITYCIDTRTEVFMMKHLKLIKKRLSIYSISSINYIWQANENTWKNVSFSLWKICVPVFKHLLYILIIYIKEFQEVVETIATKHVFLFQNIKGAFCQFMHYCITFYCAMYNFLLYVTVIL